MALELGIVIPLVRTRDNLDLPAHTYAIRVHGDRPALLWELDRHDEDAAVVLTCPGLDPSWRSTDARGEALLSAPPDAPAPAAMPGADEGDSFG